MSRNIYCEHERPGNESIIKKALFQYNSHPGLHLTTARWLQVERTACVPMLAPYIYIFHVHIFMLVSTNVLSV